MIKTRKYALTVKSLKKKERKEVHEISCALYLDILKNTSGWESNPIIVKSG